MKDKMYKENIEKSLESLPEAFYDVLTYIIPSSYLAVCILLHFSAFNSDIANLVTITKSWVFELLLGFLILGGLYFIGALITSFSYYLIHIPIVWFLRRINKNENDFYLIFGTEIFKLRIEHPLLATDLTKRYARLNLTQNIVFSNFLLILLEVFSPHNSGGIWLYYVVIIFSLISSFIRIRWLNENFEALQEKRGKK
jgi:hypothetical protein